MGKGSQQRPSQISKKQFSVNWDKVFSIHFKCKKCGWTGDIPVISMATSSILGGLSYTNACPKCGSYVEQIKKGDASNE